MPGMSHLVAEARATTPLRTVAEAGSYIGRVCFKHGPPSRIGTELEWLLTDPANPGRRPELATLAAALGEHAPRTIDPDSPARPLPAGGMITVEPGGQVEISSAPATSCADLIGAVRRDIAVLTELLEPTGFSLADCASYPDRSGHRLLRTPRYDAMADGFARISPAGATMMCATAATQVCLDLGLPDDAADRWRAAHLIGPVLLAAFANSPADGLVSSRMAAWWTLDPARTCPPESLEPEAYVDRALDTPLLARQRPDGDWSVRQPETVRQLIEAGEPLDTGDLDLHLSMLFPPVRPQGYLELRYLDAQPAGEWVAPLALLAGLFADPALLAEATEACSPTADRWQQATRLGLADPLLAAAGRELARIAGPAIERLELPPDSAEQVQSLIGLRLGAGSCPAHDRGRASDGRPSRPVPEGRRP